jgi:hypothetical protein
MSAVEGIAGAAAAAVVAEDAATSATATASSAHAEPGRTRLVHTVIASAINTAMALPGRRDRIMRLQKEQQADEERLRSAGLSGRREGQ